MKENMKIKTINLSQEEYKGIDALQNLKNIDSRSEVIRLSLNEYFNEIYEELKIFSDLCKMSNYEHNPKLDGVSTVNLTERQLLEISKITSNRYFFSDSELIREAVKHYIIKEYKKLKEPKKEVIPIKSNNIKIPNGDGTHTVLNIKGEA